MGYQLRMHSEIRDWLTDLRGAEPELGRLVGEAVVALLDAGESLRPPLVVPLESVLRPPDDPREALDYSYQRQLEILQTVRRSVADVATSRYRVELQARQLEESAAKLASQRRDALDSGNEQLAQETRMREAGVKEQLSHLRHQLSSLKGEEQRVTAGGQRLQAKVDAFRTRKETIKATYTAAEASRTIREAFAAIGEDASDLEMPDAEARELFGLSTEPPAAIEILEGIPDLTATSEYGSGSADQGDVPAPPGMMELRPGAPDSEQVGLLFVVEPQDTAVLVAWVEDPGGSPAEYQELMPLAVARLAMAQSAPPATAALPVAFISYEAESFLDEFFPGEETEVEIGAAALVARNRAHTLAQARERMRLTQAQVAKRMNVRQERVSAIERAEPGAAEVRTLAAYVRALGGRLEVIADIGDERIVLRWPPSAAAARKSSAGHHTVTLRRQGRSCCRAAAAARRTVSSSGGGPGRCRQPGRWSSAASGRPSGPVKRVSASTRN
jgi:DNA-binding XRE family transcriptional regulator